MELVDYVNNNQQLFEASYTDANELRKKLMKPHYDRRIGKPQLQENEEDTAGIPESFDARTHWPHCPSISLIRDQADCGSCWAFAVGESISDRVCIATDANKTAEFSVEDILTCCDECGFGCDGGFPDAAWEYFVSTGVVTGGLYGTKNACRPYEISPCGNHPNETFYRNCTGVSTPSCKTSCQKGYPVSYKDDKTRGRKSYNLANSVSAIQKDILKHGPLVATFSVYEDFMYYKKGIYRYTHGGYEGGHAVRILGWGVENNVKYWIIANSWNTDWGEDGFFRMVRGINDCGIEESVSAGLY
ncbi:papain family cysteine protease [Dictyocaulus viviparus]|uniref:Papain family cysteine protease n=1 Tax=Dictyocaulus viviparus TaxID=29172 RepID=A0A0D8Y6Q9_DICVI|nr:papain family cysteine protease [Dictyocaulus viviparus]